MTAVVIGSSEHMAEIRSMAGGPSDTEISSTRLTGYYNDAKNWVELGTGLNVADVNSAEKGYSNVKDCITFRASVLIRYGWRDKENKAQEHSAEARRLIVDIQRSMQQATSASNSSSILTSTEYMSAGMNSNIADYKSPGFGGMVF